MKHKGKLLLLSVFLVAMLIPLFGCGSSGEETFDGALISATDDTLILGRKQNGQKGIRSAERITAKGRL